MYITAYVSSASGLFYYLGNQINHNIPSISNFPPDAVQVFIDDNYYNNDSYYYVPSSISNNDLIPCYCSNSIKTTINLFKQQLGIKETNQDKINLMTSINILSKLSGESVNSIYSDLEKSVTQLIEGQTSISSLLSTTPWNASMLVSSNLFETSYKFYIDYYVSNIEEELLTQLYSVSSISNIPYVSYQSNTLITSSTTFVAPVL